jgi:thiol:disulfide interchange protein
MKKAIYYLPRILSILIVCFFAIFILEGFGPDFGWQDSLMHGLLALVVLVVTITSWKWPKIGGWIFIVLGIRYLLGAFSSGWWWSLIIGGIPLITGILFLIQGFKDKKVI